MLVAVQGWRGFREAAIFVEFGDDWEDEWAAFDHAVDHLFETDLEHVLELATFHVCLLGYALIVNVLCLA